MDEKTTKRIIEYYNMGLTMKQISEKRDINYSWSTVRKVLNNNRDKITRLKPSKMSKETEQLIIKYYNMGLTRAEISNKKDTAYSLPTISKILQANKDKINRRNPALMDIETEAKIIKYYNEGYSIREIEMKDDIYYSFCAIRDAINRNKDKVNFLTLRDIREIFNIKSDYAIWNFIQKSNIDLIRGTNKKSKLNKRISINGFKKYLENNQNWKKYNYDEEVLSKYINLDDSLKVNVQIEKINGSYKRTDVMNTLRLKGFSEKNKYMWNLGAKKNVKSKVLRKERFVYVGRTCILLNKDEVKEFAKFGRYKHRNKALLEWLEKN